MCDCYGGSILVSFEADDEAALFTLEEYFQGHARFLEEAVPERIASFVHGLRHRYVQIDVPDGETQAAGDMFRLGYVDRALREGGPDALLSRLRDPDATLFVHPEALASSSVSSAGVSATSGFSFSADHASTMATIGARLPVLNPNPVTVGLVDTGLDNAALGLTPVRETDLTVSPVTSAAPDNFGHGSVVAQIVQDVAPDAAVAVYKVADQGDVREWTFLAGLASAAGDNCDIINASLGFGLQDRMCRTCGRDFGTTRSLVFQRMLYSLLDMNPNTVFVASAGNGSAPEPIYPARYGTALCVAATNGGGDVATFSNTGAVDENGYPRNSFVMAPGGDRFDPNTGIGSDVFVASFKGTDWRGTSFATGYVSGILADHQSRAGAGARSTAITSLVGAANAGAISGYNHAIHGAGEVRRI